MSNNNEDDDDKEPSQCLKFLESTTGWTPHLYDKIHRVRCGESSCSEWLQAMFYTFAFVVDLADAIIDLCLSIQTIYYGNDDPEGGGIGLGILLGVMTLAGRFITGLYGKLSKKHVEENEGESTRVLNYIITELSVFMLEDGAAILLLVKNPSLGALERISLYLTLICAGGFIFVIFCFLLFALIGVVCFKSEYGRAGCIGVSFCIIISGFPSFLLYLLFQEVLMKEADEEEQFSQGLQTASYVIYGIGSFLIASIAISALCGGLG